MLQQKIILIDYSFLMFQAIYSYNSAMERKELDTTLFVSPSTYIAMSSLISCLKKIGYNDEQGDKIILAGDGRDSWRKEIEKSYKGNRADQRKQARYVDWTMEFDQHNELLKRIEENLPFFIIKIEHCEADDIIAEAVRYFKDCQCVIVSPDEDMHQLLTYDNVRVFSPHPKVKLHPYRILSLDRNKEKDMAFKSIMKKIEKEKTDNLCAEILTEKEYDDRQACVSLLTLPKDIVDKIKPELDKIANVEKEFFNPEVFSPGIAKRLPSIFGTENIITYEDCVAYTERKLKRDKNKKEKVKELKKKGKEQAEEITDDTQSDLVGDRIEE